MFLESLRWLALFLLFGYAEYVFKLGVVVSACIGLYHFWKKNTFFSLISPTIQGVLIYYNHRQASYGVFVAYNVLLVVLEASRMSENNDEYSSDMHIEMKPFEKEIRTLLFKKDPSKLHWVDKEMKAYVGKEETLYRELQQEYGGSGRDDNPMVTPVKAGKRLWQAGRSVGTSIDKQSLHLSGSNNNISSGGGGGGGGVLGGATGAWASGYTPSPSAPAGRYVNEYTPDANSYYESKYREEAFRNRYSPEYSSTLGLPMKEDSIVSKREQIMAEIEKIFREYHPSLLPRVESLMQTYKGREHVLIQQLCDEYGCNVPANLLTNSAPTIHDLMMRPGMTYGDAENIRAVMWEANKKGTKAFRW